MDIKKSRFSEIKKKMRKLTAVKDKPIKEKTTKEKTAKKSNKKQKITQSVKVNVNTSTQPSQGQPYQLPISFNTDNLKNLQNTIIELLKKNNNPSITERFNIATNTQIPNRSMETQTDTSNRDMETQTINPNSSMETQTENIPKKSMRSQTENIPKTSMETQTINPNRSMETQTINPNRSMETQTMDMFSEKVLKPSLYDMINRVKEYNERVAMGEEDKRLPLINIPKDTSNLGMFERINESPEEEGYGLKISGDEPTEEKKKVGRKPSTQEYKEQKAKEKEENRLRNNKQINEEAFSRLLTKVAEPAEYKELTEMFNTGQLPKKALKNKLLKYGFSKEKIEEIYKNYH